MRDRLPNRQIIERCVLSQIPVVCGLIVPVPAATPGTRVTHWQGPAARVVPSLGEEIVEADAIGAFGGNAVAAGALHAIEPGGGDVDALCRKGRQCVVFLRKAVRFG